MYRSGNPKALVAILVLPSLLAGTWSRAAVSDEEALVDPTAPLFLNQAQTPADNTELLGNLFSSYASYSVNSILIRPNLKVAVINSERVSVGDMVGNAEVVAIEPARVILSIDGQQRIVEMYEQSIKRKSGNE